jgi:hypothetical protein
MSLNELSTKVVLIALPGDELLRWRRGKAIKPITSHATINYNKLNLYESTKSIILPQSANQMSFDFTSSASISRKSQK